MRKVLFVEDEKLICKTYERLFRDKYDMTFVDNVETAIDLIKEKDFDCIVSDNVLDGQLTGKELYLWVRANKPELISRFVFVSSHDLSSLHTKSLVKPAPLAALRAALSSCI